MTSIPFDVDSSDVADVVVVGSGPSGAVVSHTLATRGLSVACLEQGDWVNPSDFPANHPEWELLIQDQWAHDPNQRALPADYPIGVEDSDMWPVMFNAVGGTSIYYGGHWVRLMPSDFRVRTVDGVADDWPISYDELAPYYSAVAEFIGASGLAGIRRIRLASTSLCRPCRWDGQAGKPHSPRTLSDGIGGLAPIRFPAHGSSRWLNAHGGERASGGARKRPRQALIWRIGRTHCSPAQPW